MLVRSFGTSSFDTAWAFFRGVIHVQELNVDLPIGKVMYLFLLSVVAMDYPHAILQKRITMNNQKYQKIIKNQELVIHGLVNAMYPPALHSCCAPKRLRLSDEDLTRRMLGR